MEVRGLLLRLVTRKLANNFGIAAILSVICQGIGCVAVLEEFITVDASEPWRNDSRKDPYLRLNSYDELVDANLPSARETERFSSRAFGKRFIATFFNFDNQHWVAAIFDQAEAHLYVYDTYRRNRKARVKACGLAWRAFALNIGLPCAFRVFSPPLPEQPGNWECGYLGLINIHQALRALVGKAYKGEQAPRVHWLEADDRPARSTIVSNPPLLLIPDWTFGAEDTGEGWRRANTILRAIMCNELGLRSLAELREKLQAGEREDGCYDFCFCESVPGEPISLVLRKEGPWRSKDAVDRHAPLYVGNGSRMMVGLHEEPPLPQKPASWEPFRRQILRNVRGAAEVKDLFRSHIRGPDFDNTKSSLNGIRYLTAATGPAAITVSSGDAEQ